MTTWFVEHVDGRTVRVAADRWIDARGIAQQLLAAEVADIEVTAEDDDCVADVESHWAGNDGGRLELRRRDVKGLWGDWRPARDFVWHWARDV